VPEPHRAWIGCFVPPLTAIENRHQLFDELILCFEEAAEGAGQEKSIH
jgi:hypothetical protein